MENYTGKRKKNIVFVQQSEIAVIAWHYITTINRIDAVLCQSFVHLFNNFMLLTIYIYILYVKTFLKK